MARLFPADIDATSSSAQLEAPTALRLHDELPDDWWVIHACHWTLLERRHIGQGEVDFVVVSPGGSIGLIEQKNGSVTVEGEEYIKHYGLLRKSVSHQMGRSRAAVMKKLAQANMEALSVVSILFVPDVDVVRVGGSVSTSGRWLTGLKPLNCRNASNGCSPSIRRTRISYEPY